MAFLVRDFIHTAPANTARKVRRGAATAFLDASGELLAGYSYNTCLYAVAPAADYPQGRLYENGTRYGPSSSRHARWLSGFIAAQYECTWVQAAEFNEHGYRPHSRVAPANGDPADAIDVPRGASAADLIALCHGGERGIDAPYHASTTFAPPDGNFSCAYFIANRVWLDQDQSAYWRGMLGNEQRIAAVLAYEEWQSEDPCGCEPCNKAFGSAA